MPSSFDDQFASFAAPNLRETFGQAITYTVDETDTTVVGMVGEETAMEEETPAGREQRTVRDVEIGRDANADTGSFSVDAGGIANPRLDATLTIGGVLYAVEGIVDQNAYSTTLRVVRIESLERSRAKYRG